MDAHALLQSQGWRGSGHSFHKTDDNIGLAKPILVSRKNNTLGVGRKNHVTSDQWWLNALDEQLKNLDTSNKTSIVQTTTKSTKLDSLLTSGAGKYSGANGLYAFFVSGGLLHGSLRDEEGESTDATPEAEVTPARKETKEEKRARREEKRRRKAAKLAKQNAAAAETWKSDKSKTKGRDKSKKDKESAKKDATTVTKSRKKSTVPESKEERRARKEAKRKRRQEKEARRKIEEG